MTALIVPKPKIQKRPINPVAVEKAESAGCDPILAKLLASRVEPTLPVERFLDPKLSFLDNPNALADCQKAAKRIAKAIEAQEIIGIETDHDCDGQTSHAVIERALTQYFGAPKSQLCSFIGHRLKEGYGLSDPVADRILASDPRPSVVITADNGSADEPRIARLKAAGIDVIVTDHHEIPKDGIPQSAYAVVSPLRTDCQYTDKAIAGCMVAWLVMAATRQVLNEIRGEVLPSLGGLLDFVAVGTIADCVSMANSTNNRIVVRYGLKIMQQRLRPCWRVLFEANARITSEDLGFKIGPLLNSDGRLACAFGSVSFLLAETDEEAQDWVTHLREQNTQRKSIQDRITQQALQEASKQTLAGKLSLCIFLEEGHAGVHGISASRIKDHFGRPTIILCPKEGDAELITGSARSIPELHLKNILQALDEAEPNCLEKFGGHAGAAGLTLKRKNLQCFSDTLEALTRAELQPEQVGPVIWSDGALPDTHWDKSYVEQLNRQLAPFGRGFEPPQFEAVGTIISLQPVGQTKIHARLEISMGDIWFEGIWFNAIREGEAWPVGAKDSVHFVYTPKVEIFRGKKTLKGQIIYLESVK